MSVKPTNRKFVRVRFADSICATAAFNAARRHFNCKLAAHENLSKVDGSTVFFQSNSVTKPDEDVKDFLLGCEGAIPDTSEGCAQA